MTTDTAADLLLDAMSTQSLLEENARLRRCAEFGEGVLSDLAEMCEAGGGHNWAEQLRASVQIMRIMRRGELVPDELVAKAIGKAGAPVLTGQQTE